MDKVLVCVVVFIALTAFVCYAFAQVHEQANAQVCVFAGGTPNIVMTPFSFVQGGYTNCSGVRDEELWKENAIADGVNNQVLMLALVFWCGLGFWFMVHLTEDKED